MRSRERMSISSDPGRTGERKPAQSDAFRFETAYTRRLRAPIRANDRMACLLLLSMGSIDSVREKDVLAQKHMRVVDYLSALITSPGAK